MDYLPVFFILVLHKCLYPISFHNGFFIINSHNYRQLTCSVGGGAFACLEGKGNAHAEIAQENHRAPVGLPEVKL